MSRAIGGGMAGNTGERHLGALSELATLVATGAATTRGALAGATGMSRAGISQRVDQLISGGVMVEDGRSAAVRGRPPLTLRISPDLGVVCAVDLGATRCRLVLADLGGVVLDQAVEEIDIGEGPERILNRTHELLGALLEKTGRTAAQVRAIAIGVPGPVDFATGTVVRPPIMPGWDGCRVPAFFAGPYDAPVLVDNDVNLMALGEFGRHRSAEHLLYVKAGTGIGCGIVSGGRLHRGAAGAAGDIGHIRVPGHEEVLCDCGNTGCVEAVASGRALVATLRQEGVDVEGTEDVVRLVSEGNPLARRHVRTAGKAIGEVLAAAVSFHNPDVIVLGGSMAALHEDLLADIRGVIYGRALPLATRSLSIETSSLGDRAGTEGGYRLALDHLLTPTGLGRLLRR